MQPRIVELEASMIIGLGHHGRNENEEIPRIWRTFWPRKGELKNHIEQGASFGILHHFDPETGAFDYVAGLKTANRDDAPSGMTCVEVPAQSYAAFDCTLPTLMQTIRTFHSERLPDSGYKRGPGPEFEHYDQHFAPDIGELGMSMYFPVDRLENL